MVQDWAAIWRPLFVPISCDDSTHKVTQHLGHNLQPSHTLCHSLNMPHFLLKSLQIFACHIKQLEGIFMLSRVFVIFSFSLDKF